LFRKLLCKMNEKLKRNKKGKNKGNNNMSKGRNNQHSHHNRTEVKVVKREIVYQMNDLRKSVLGLFGLEEGDNVGMMAEPSVRDLDRLLKDFDDLKAYFGGLV